MDYSKCSPPFQVWLRASTPSSPALGCQLNHLILTVFPGSCSYLHEGHSNLLENSFSLAQLPFLHQLGHTCSSAQHFFPPGPTCPVQQHSTPISPRDRAGRSRKILTCVRRLTHTSAITHAYFFQKNHTNMQLNSSAHHTYCVKKFI